MEWVSRGYQREGRERVRARAREGKEGKESMDGIFYAWDSSFNIVLSECMCFTEDHVMLRHRTKGLHHRISEFQKHGSLSRVQICPCLGCRPTIQ